MQWLKFSLITGLIFSSSFSHANKFSSQDCLNSKFLAQIEHKGKFFGLLENKLKIKKDICNLEIMFKGILETTWKIDVCREPIHMKVKSKGSQDVYKRQVKCEKQTKSDYCYFRHELLNNIQDHGLIFAEGQREDLKQDHGQIYCSYLLLQRYLDDGLVFSTFEPPKNIYNEQKACEIPQGKEKKLKVEKSSNTEQIDSQLSTGASNRGMRPMSEGESEIVNQLDKEHKF